MTRVCTINVASAAAALLCLFRYIATAACLLIRVVIRSGSIIVFKIKQNLGKQLRTYNNLVNQQMQKRGDPADC
jgi:hypothetical protein